MQIGFGLSIMGVPQVASQGGGGPAPAITIASGSGYAGAVYASTVPGLWYAGDTLVGDGGTWVMTAEHEGKPVRCGASNLIRMGMPVDLGMADFDARTGKTIADGKITQWIDRSTGIIATQSTASRQPVDGGDFISSSRETGLDVPENLAPYQVSTDGSTKAALQIGGTSTSAELSAIGERANIVVICGGSSANTVDVYINGALAQSGITGTQVTQNSTLSFIFEATQFVTWHIFNPIEAQGPSLLNRKSDYNRGLIGRIFRLSAKKSALSAEERQYLEGILAWTYDLAFKLPADHPYKTKGPQVSA